MLKMNLFFFSEKFISRLTYLLIPWCRFLLEKLTGLQLAKKFPAFYGTWRFITALTSVRHLSLSKLLCETPVLSLKFYYLDFLFLLLLF